MPGGVAVTGVLSLLQSLASSTDFAAPKVPRWSAITRDYAIHARRAHSCSGCPSEPAGARLTTPQWGSDLYAGTAEHHPG